MRRRAGGQEGVVAWADSSPPPASPAESTPTSGRPAGVALGAAACGRDPRRDGAGAAPARVVLILRCVGVVVGRGVWCLWCPHVVHVRELALGWPSGAVWLGLAWPPSAPPVIGYPCLHARPPPLLSVPAFCVPFLNAAGRAFMEVGCLLSCARRGGGLWWWCVVCRPSRPMPPSPARPPPT